MTDDSVGDDAPMTFQIKSSNDAKYSITMAASSTVSALKEKLSTKDYADLPVERQRLIYSGRVLKDPDTLASYKIKEGQPERGNRQQPSGGADRCAICWIRSITQSGYVRP